jgi:hypothetical protein
MGALGLLVFALLLPMQADQIAHQILGEAVTANVASGISGPATFISNKVNSILYPSNAATPASTEDDNSPFSPENIIDATNAERVS